MAKSRLEMLCDRLCNLQKQLAAEQIADDRSEIYIDDLMSSIDNCESQINWLKAKGWYEIVNGATPCR